jgi:O-antigen ligase
MQAIGLTRVNDRISDSFAEELAATEYAYYFVIFYTAVGAPLGLVLMGGIGSGFLLIPVLALCVAALGSSILTVLHATWIPIACGASYLFIQLTLHGESLFGRYVYQFCPWIISLVIVQSLAIHRPNFLHRFAWCTLLVGLAMLPFMSLFIVDDSTQRMGLESGVGLAYANPNAVATWFGFCALYLIIKGYIEAHPAYRLALWVAAVGSLYIVALTVSRGALIAIAASLLVASRKLLKVGFLPLLLLAVLLLGLVELGIFDQVFHLYSQRGIKDSGRLQTWPFVFDKFLDSPVIGIGASNVGVFTAGRVRTPHNGFLLLAAASGIVPLILFCAYVFRSGMAALRTPVSDQDVAFYLPLFTYTVLMTNAGNMEFAAHWAVVSFAVPLAAVLRINRGASRGWRISSLRPERVE